MNRRARRKGETAWASYGPVEHVEAARRHAMHVARLTIAQSVGVDLVIETNDDDSSTVFEHECSVFLSCDVKPLRGSAND